MYIARLNTSSFVGNALPPQGFAPRPLLLDAREVYVIGVAAVIVGARDIHGLSDTVHCCILNCPKMTLISFAATAARLDLSESTCAA